MVGSHSDGVNSCEHSLVWSWGAQQPFKAQIRLATMDHFLEAGMFSKEWIDCSRIQKVSDWAWGHPNCYMPYKQKWSLVS